MEVERNAPVGKVIRRAKKRAKVVASVAAPAVVRAPRGAKKAARRAAAVVRTERLDAGVKTTSSGASVRVSPRREEKTLLGHLSAVVKPEEVRKRPGVPQALHWLRRREELAREPRPIGPGATEKSHSAERQPHCLCPGCGRAMQSALMVCPECTMRAARLIKIPRRVASVSLTWLLSQAVSR
ncbi:hypothetical protein ABS71_04155 [bacterium SCN 62-11]|nr:MAG: hypothetical protein ABS71_04155 [bacterium SCN 62-11]